MKSKIQPNAKVGEIRENARKVKYPKDYIPFTSKDKFNKKFTKGDFVYMINRGRVNAMHRPTKTIFEWSSTSRKWRELKR